MIDIVDTLRRWHAEGQRIALARVVAVERSAPREPGSALAVNERGDVVGSVSGGCVEAAVYEEAQDAIDTGRARLVTYGISDEEGIAVGLTCGGTIHVFIEPLDLNVFERLAPAAVEQHPIALATRVDAAGNGETLVVTAQHAFGDFGSSDLTRAVTAETRALLTLGETRVVGFGPDGEPMFDDVRVFVHSFAPRPRMYIFGAIDFSRAMASLGTYLGYHVVVVDARPVFATRERIPDAAEIVVAWPDEFLRQALVDERTVVIVLTHDVKFDIPLLRVALRTNAAYIGVMGSRRTHANRVAELRAAGVSDEQLARLSAPIGLDLGGRTPEETAVSIAAEIIAVRSGRNGGRLTHENGPIHVAR